MLGGNWLSVQSQRKDVTCFVIYRSNEIIPNNYKTNKLEQQKLFNVFVK
jgi:hypothetical protein